MLDPLYEGLRLWGPTKGKDGYYSWRIANKDGKVLETHKGTTDKRVSEKLANASLDTLLDKAKRISEGQEEAKKYARAEDLIAPFILEGREGRGHDNEPWNPTHARNMESRVRWFVETLKAKRLQEFQTKAVTKVLGAYRRETECSTTTLNHYGRSLHTWLEWCRLEKYITWNPMDSWKPFNKNAGEIRRAMTAEELRKYLDTVWKYWIEEGDERALNFYAWVLLCVHTGFRADESLAIRICDVVWEKGLIFLGAFDNKNKDRAEQPVPRETLRFLKWYCQGRKPEDKVIVGVDASHPSRPFHEFRELSGVAYKTAEGKLDFHALRTTYCTHIVASCQDIKTAMHLCRHKTIQMTMEVYARVQKHRALYQVQAMEDVLSAEISRSYYANDLRGEKKTAQFEKNNEKSKVEAAGIEPVPQSSDTPRQGNDKHKYLEKSEKSALVTAPHLIAETQQDNSKNNLTQLLRKTDLDGLLLKLSPEQISKVAEFVSGLLKGKKRGAA